MRWVAGAAAGAVLWWAGLAQAQEQAPAAAADTPSDDVWRFEGADAAHGARLYRRYCGGCHGEDGRGGAHTFMPHVGNLTRKDYIEFLPDSYLYIVIAGGGAAVGKNNYMPAWEATLSAQDIQDIIAHIRTLPTY